MPSDSFAVLTSPYEGADEFDRSQPFEIHRTKEPVLLPYPWMVRRVNSLAQSFGADFVVLDPAVPLGLIGPSLSLPYDVIVHGAEVTVPGRIPGSRQALGWVLRNARGDSGRRISRSRSRTCCGVCARRACRPTWRGHRPFSSPELHRASGCSSPFRIRGGRDHARRRESTRPSKRIRYGDRGDCALAFAAKVAMARFETRKTRDSMFIGLSFRANAPWLVSSQNCGQRNGLRRWSGGFQPLDARAKGPRAIGLPGAIDARVLLDSDAPLK